MSRGARFAVRVAAAVLPAGIQERYREEWLADLDGAAEAGVRASTIAVGALLFSATVHRDTPDVLGMPLSTAARRHARWATALLSSAAVLAVGSYITGGFGSGGAIAIAASLVTGLTLLVAVAGLVALWRAALISSPLAKIGAATVTTGVIAVAASGGVGWFALPLGLVVLLVGTCIGLVAWAGSTFEPPAPAAAPQPAAVPETGRRFPTALVVAMVVAGTLLSGAILLFSGITFLLAALVIPVAIVVLAVLFVVRARRTAREPAPASAWGTVLVLEALSLATVAVGALDLLVWSPLAQAPAFTLDEIWAALSPADAATGFGFAVGWIVFWALASLIYLAGSIAVLGRHARPSTRMLAAAGLLLVSGAVFFQFWAGFSIGMSIADTLPPYTGGGSDVRAWYAMTGQFSLVGALILGIAPRPLASGRPVAVTA